MNAPVLTLRRIRYALVHRVGLPGLFGLVLLAAAGIGTWILVPAWHQEADTARRQGSAASEALRRARLDHGAKPKTADAFAHLNEILPAFNQNAADLRRLVSQAEQAKVELGKGEYHLSDERGAAFVKYDVVLPVKASYATLRAFIAGVLQAVPNASLAELRLERSAVTTPVQDARLHFTLIYRGT